MKKLFSSFVLSFLLFLLVSPNLQAQEAKAHFSLDACTARLGNIQSNTDFSEFKADITNIPEITLTVVGDNLYRTDPVANPHSCTPGINGSRAMCVGSTLDCSYEPDSDKAVKFDIAVIPVGGQAAILSSLDFYENAPMNFTWLDGASGMNNYPLKYGIRVIKNGIVIHEESEISTTTEWSLESFDFSDNPEFIVSVPTVFSVELLAYCPIGNVSTVNAWDLDEITLTAVPCGAAGGTLTGGPFTFCVGDGNPDNIAAGDITLSGNMGTSQWVVTDEDGNILGLPADYTDVDFENAPVGTCLIWHLSYQGAISGVEMGMNATDFKGCFSLSNPITVNRTTTSGGTLTGGPFSFCVGDSTPDMIANGEITLSGNMGSNGQWVVTDDAGNILGLPANYTDVNFDDAPAGTCLIWYLSYEDGLTGAEIGMNASNLAGCFSLSNPITVNRGSAEGGTLTGGPFNFCVGDGNADMINDGEITLSGNSGTNSQWVVTDDLGNILGLPPSYTAVNFDDAPAGTCLIWHLSYEDGLSGAEVGMNASNLAGCFSLSNPITVNRTSTSGGTLEGGPFSFCVGDGTADMIADGEITLSGNMGSNGQWVVTDDAGNILGLPANYTDVNFDEAPIGVCLIWYLSYEDGLSGAEVGMNAANLSGCFSLSNPITVNRGRPDGGTLEGGPYSFCVGDGNPDNIVAGDITLSGNTGSLSQWVVTDQDGNILGLPDNYTDVNFDDAPSGICYVWHLSYEDGITGAEMGMNAMNIRGCFSLSNPITVNRTRASGGTLEGGPYSFCVNDGNPDNIPAGGITLSGNEGTFSQWVVTDPDGTILGMPDNYTDVNFDDAGTGTCFVWHISYEPGITGLMMGMNVNNLMGCFSISNAVTVNRNIPEGGTLEGGPYTFCVGDGNADMIPDGSISLSGNIGSNGQWVVTDADGNILGLPNSYADVNFDDAPAGVCLIWHISYEDGLMGAEVGMNAADIQGCFAISNSITVNRNSSGSLSGGNLEGGPFDFCVGNGEPDLLLIGTIILSGNTGSNSQWVVTDEDGVILGLPASYTDVDFDTAPAGTCLIWHLSYEDGLVGLERGANANNLVGCFSLSNPVTIIRSSTSGGALVGGPFSYCVGDGNADMLADGDITLSGNMGSNSQWVVTDEDGNILGLPANYTDVNFDDAPAGTCLIWHLSYEDGLVGAEVGMNAANLTGCYSLSNAVAVYRNSAPSGGTLTGGPFSFCVGDGEEDIVAAGDISLSGSSGSNSQWVITDADGNILGLPANYFDVNFDEADEGVCLIWHLSYEDGLSGAEVGMNAANLTGCFSLSNPITVNRNEVNGGRLQGGPFSFCVGDGSPDMIPAGAIKLEWNIGSNHQWVVTDEDGNILGLPANYADVNFDDAPTGVCLIWHLSYEDGLMGAEVGMNANNLSGCYDLSNPISVIRNEPPLGGRLSGGPFNFCVGDGMADTLTPIDVGLTDKSGTFNQWVVTDETETILGFSDDLGDINFDTAPAGVCLLWYISYENVLEGLESGMKIDDITGCFAITNSVTINRTEVNGGTLEGGPFDFCVGDGTADMIAAGDISLSGNIGTHNQWVVTDNASNILGLYANYTDINFDDAPSGVCLIWHISYEDELTDAHLGMNTSDIEGCFDLSNPITVNRTRVDGGTIEGGPFSFCVGDGNPDFIGVGDISVTSSEGNNRQWVVTDEDGNILGLPANYSDVDFEDAPVGVCLIWYLSYEDGLTGAEVGMNAANLQGCFNLSNPITVYRNTAPTAGVLSGGPFNFCVGDGTADMITAGDITLSGNMGSNSQWIVTDDNGNILGLPANYTDVNFDDAPAGVCYIWHLSYEEGIRGVQIGMNAANIAGCFAISNPITVNRNTPQGGVISSDNAPYEFCVGDGTADMIADGDITLTDEAGTFGQWLITDSDGIILGMPDNYSDVDFDGAGIGSCFIWYVSYEPGVTGLSMGMDADDISGCFSISNSIEVKRNNCSGIVNTNELRISSSPNPTADQVNVKVSNIKRSQGQIMIFDAIGELIHQEEITENDTVEKVFDLSNFSEGVYIIKVKSGFEVVTSKIIKISAE